MLDEGFGDFTHYTLGAPAVDKLVALSGKGDGEVMGGFEMGGVFARGGSA